MTYSRKMSVRVQVCLETVCVHTYTNIHLLLTCFSQIKHCSSNLEVPLNYIFPVKSYHEEIHLNNNMDVLLLSALTTILNLANEYASGIRKRRSFPYLFEDFSQYKEQSRTDSHTCGFELEELRKGEQTSKNLRPQYAESEI